jgi:hypothetical protein
MNGNEFTHKDLSRLLGISETTIKSYRRKFPGCIPVAGYGKPIRFGEDALRVARRIRDLFEHGLSVPETRARLAGEFDWITGEPADPAAGERRPAREDDEGRAPDRNAVLAGLARNMVEVFLSQKEIIRRLDHLAALLQAVPADGVVFAPAASSAQERAEREEPPRPSALVVPLRGRDTPDPPGPPAGAVRARERNPVEPPRRFLALPLVAAAGSGGYIGAGGRKRGRFSLNDLKAMFVFSFAPPRHFRFLWEEEGDAWILRLEQEQGGRRIRILLAERSLRGGIAAVEILSLEDNGEDLHPAEICAVIDSLGC